MLLLYSLILPCFFYYSMATTIIVCLLIFVKNAPNLKGSFRTFRKSSRKKCSSFNFIPPFQDKQKGKGI